MLKVHVSANRKVAVECYGLGLEERRLIVTGKLSNKIDTTVFSAQVGSWRFCGLETLGLLAFLNHDAARFEKLWRFLHAGSSCDRSIESISEVFGVRVDSTFYLELCDFYALQVAKSDYCANSNATRNLGLKSEEVWSTNWFSYWFSDPSRRNGIRKIRFRTFDYLVSYDRDGRISEWDVEFQWENSLKELILELLPIENYSRTLQDVQAQQLGPDWIVQDGFLIYPKPIVPEYACVSTDSGSYIHTLKEKARKQFTIPGLKIDLRGRVFVLGDSEEVKHPHCYRDGRICLGDMASIYSGYESAIPVTEIPNVITALKTINLSSPLRLIPGSDDEIFEEKKVGKYYGD